MTWIGSALAFTGLVLLTGNGFPISVLLWTNTYPNCAFVIALEIILIGYFAGK
jgi:hypothetical protein